jgi:ABC-type lipoprotein release transport system permease subunit
LTEQRFSQAQIDNGMALNAAILLHDPSRLVETHLRVQASVDKAGLGLKVVDWRAATGIVGQFVSLAGLVLFVSISIIFVVAIVIMNNTMVMATSERATEIGTMRAIGSTRSFILALFLLETLMLGGVAGVIGASSGFAMMSALASSGIPAPSDELIFLFSGPRLYPVVSAEHVVTALILILVVSLVATLYPALLATRIQPVVAMTARE